MAANIPPNAGPIENPRLMAILLSEKERVIFSGRAYTLIETEFAGLNVSVIVLNTKTPIDKLHTSFKRGNKKKMGTDKIMLVNCTLKCPTLSVSQPPKVEPAIAPNPKQLNTTPVCDSVNLSSATIYTPRKGNTIAPILLINITADNIHDGRDNPRYESK